MTPDPISDDEAELHALLSEPIPTVEDDCPWLWLVYGVCIVAGILFFQS